MDKSEFEFLTIEPAKYGSGYAVKGYKKRKSGVMKGQTLPHYLEGFDTFEEAQQAYPEARAANKYTVPQPSYNHLPEDRDPPVGSAGRLRGNGEFEGG